MVFESFFGVLAELSKFWRSGYSVNCEVRKLRPAELSSDFSDLSCCWPNCGRTFATWESFPLFRSDSAGPVQAWIVNRGSGMTIKKVRSLRAIALVQLSEP